MYSSILRSSRMRSGGIESSEGAYSSDCAGSAQGLGLRSDGHGERSDGDPGFPEVSLSEREALLGEPFLGAGLLRGYDRLGRGDDPRLGEVSGEEGTSGGATQVASVNRGSAGTTRLASSGGQLLSPPMGGIKQGQVLWAWLFTLDCDFQGIGIGFNEFRGR